MKNFDFVNREIKDLLGTGCVTICSVKPDVVNPLSVSINSKGKPRLILDLRYINNFLYKFPVKYEGLNIFRQYVSRKAYMVKFDMKSGYHHIDIFPDHTKYLGFSWSLDGVRNYFKFTVLPFGISSACNVFTKFLRPLVKKWREIGIKIVLYLDDGIIVNENRERLLKQISIVRNDLLSAGIVVNEEKSCGIPTRRLEWLGIVIDLTSYEFLAPSEKIECVKNSIRKIFSMKLITARQLFQANRKLKKVLSLCRLDALITCRLLPR